MSRFLISCLLLLLASPAAAWYVSAGGSESDVGLDEKRSGFFVGVGERWPRPDSHFDVAAELAYVQRAGSQPLIFTDGVLPAFRDDAEVRLHMLRPALFGGVTIPAGRVEPRLYTGFSVAVKLAESWTKPEGETNRVYGYEDIDAEMHLGVSVGVGRLFLDFRYNHGLLDQLVDRDFDNAGSWTKAGDDLAGVKTPEGGDNVSSWQVGAGFGF